MAYRVQAGGSFQVLHDMRRLDDAGSVSGSAGTLVAKLLDPATFADTGVTVTITEIGTTGHYTASGTVPAAWTIGQQALVQLQEPANAGFDPAAGRAGRYTWTVEVVSAGIIGAALTTLARVKQQFAKAGGGVFSGTDFDGLLGSLIAETTAHVIGIMGGRQIVEATWTEYMDGDSTPTLWLSQGPLVSVAGLWEVDWTDVAGVRTETLTLVPAGDYNLLVQRTLGEDGLAALRFNTGEVFYHAVQGWKVTYTAGYVTIPDALVRAATFKVVQDFLTREAQGLASKALGDATMERLSGEDVDTELERALAGYMGGVDMVI